MEEVAAATKPAAKSTKQAQLESMMQRPGGRRSGEVWAVFQAADADGGGTVDQGEIGTMCKKLGVRLTEEELTAAMKAMDRDGNGMIEYDEFYNWWGSDAGIAIRRRLTRPDAMSGPVDGSSAVAGIDPRLVKQLEMHTRTKVESRSRPGRIFKLEKQPIELTVACNTLAHMGETGGNMSVFAVLRTWNPIKEWWAEHGRTETLRENSPKFATSFLLDYVDHDDDYSSEFTQWIKIELYQRKSQMSDLAIHVKQGEMVFSLRSIYRTPVFRTTNDIETGGTMTVRMLKVPREASTVGSLQLKVRANLAGMSTGVDNHICPYFQILRYVEGVFEPMYRSKVVRNTNIPTFEDVHLPPHHVAHLLKEEVYIKVEVYDMESRGDPRCLGAIETTLPHLLADSANGKRHREKTGRSVASWNGCHYVLGPQDTRKNELAKPVDTAPNGRSIKIGALYDDQRQKKAEAQAAKALPQGGMTQQVKLAAPKEGMHKSGRRKLKPASALEAEGTASFGTFGEDERFLANLMMEQNFRETDLREVVDESLQYIDERRTHWLAQAATGAGSERKKKKAGGGRGGYVSSGMGAVLDWGDSPAKPKTKRAKAKEAADAKRAELAAKSAARKQATVADARDTGSQKPAKGSSRARQLAPVPHTDASLAAQTDRKTQRAAVDASQSMPELGSKEYNVDDWQDDADEEKKAGGDKRSQRHRHDSNAAAHGALPRLNITQRWDTFAITASDEMVIHQHRLRRRQKQRKQSYELLRDTYVPDHTQVLEGVLSDKIRSEIRNADPRVSALPSKSEMKKRHVQRRAHERLHGGSAERSGGEGGNSSGSILALSHPEKRRQELEQLQAAGALKADAAGALKADAPALNSSTGTGLSGLMHVPTPDWQD